MKTSCLEVIAAVLILQAPMKVHCAILSFNQFHTTFRAFGHSDVRPTTIEEITDPNAKHDSKSFVRINDDHSGCSLDFKNDKYAGYRYVQKSKIWPNSLQKEGKPNMVIIYDKDGKMAGAQSLLPSNSFQGWDCSENEFYTKDTIDNEEFCVTTIYFRDPATICYANKTAASALYLQKGKYYYPENLVKFPETLLDVARDSENWHVDKYFLGMGHHARRNEHGSEDCKMHMPVQILYAYVDGHCVNTGFDWQHYNNNVTDYRFSKEGDEWENPPAIAVKSVLNGAAKCQLDSADKGLVKTYHGFLGGSTTYCFHY